MLENLKNLSEIKKKLKVFLKDKNILEVVIFGSFIKGKAIPNDIDVALIGNDVKLEEVEGFHISVISPEDFFNKIPSLVNTLFREGYSLKKDRFLSEVYGFSNKVLYSYDLTGLNNSRKVQVVSFLRGKKNEKGLVIENSGEWVGNKMFFCSILKDNLFESYFIENKIKFKKWFVLIH